MYLIVNSLQRAQNISNLFYRLRRPAPSGDDGTLYWISIITHSDGRAALDASDVGDARIDPQAVPDQLVDLIKNNMTAQEIEDAKQAIRAARGSRVRLGQIVPQKVKDRLVSREVLEADGWFTENE